LVGHLADSHSTSYGKSPETKYNFVGHVPAARAIQAHDILKKHGYVPCVGANADGHGLTVAHRKASLMEEAKPAHTQSSYSKAHDAAHKVVKKAQKDGLDSNKASGMVLSHLTEKHPAVHPEIAGNIAKFHVGAAYGI
jgi:hypothetical protein